ncbi:MAG: flagellar basal body P-ring formation protein FlgA [Synergistaceae bacterium]|nr:flagellar basal body P-ring formation protein FlgA [Synergistaceae bacterium]MBQ9574290.1 flagellar basal body P-ring formation protein FlgA [Synergistaceae bacterium]
MLLLFVMLTFEQTPAFSAQSIVIEIPEVVYSRRDSMTLGQIAKISGASQRVRKLISSIRVYPENGQLSRKDVINALDESSLSDARIELRMPMYSRVEQPYYEGNFTETAQPERSRSVNDLIPQIKALSAWNGGLEISASSPVPEGRLIDPASIVPGTSGVTLRFMDDNGRMKPLNVRLTWLQNALIAAKNIRKGDRISAGDVFTRQIKITKPGIYASSPNETAGFTSNRNIKQGEPILLSYLTSSSTLKKGRRVKIVASYGGANASTDGILLEEGRQGDWVQVRRADDRRVTLRARIIDDNTVEVRVD